MTDFPTITRHAIVLVPNKACLDWVKSCPDCFNGSMPGPAEREPTVYLVPEESVDHSLRRHYRAMFEEELASWYTDTSAWPADLSYETFERFFTILKTSMVYDLGKGKIVHDED